MNTIKLTPKQLKAIANKIGESYSKIYPDDKKIQSYYDHIIIDGEMIKIGYVHNETNNRTILDIRIVYKGVVDGK